MIVESWTEAPPGSAEANAADEYTIATPEAVTFGYPVAGIGSRFIGALVDTFLIGALLFLLNLLVVVAINATTENWEFSGGLSDDPGWLAGLVLAIYALLNFAIFWGYYLIFELGWHGQTPGKRLAGTRVVKLDGGGPGFLEVAIRNLVRLVDFLPFGYALGFVTMFFNRNARRLGDFAAGTLVIRQAEGLKLDALMQTTTTATPLSAPLSSVANQPPDIPNLRRLTGDDYQLICTVLDRQMRGQADPMVLLRLARAIATKLDAPLPGPNRREAQRFLYSVAEAYRLAARQP
jgi:uncharacterized RDD family membrane protein YckC